jgi:hypothetical protein
VILTFFWSLSSEFDLVQVTISDFDLVQVTIEVTTGSDFDLVVVHNPSYLKSDIYHP